MGEASASSKQPAPIFSCVDHGRKTTTLRDWTASSSRLCPASRSTSDCCRCQPTCCHYCSCSSNASGKRPNNNDMQALPSPNCDQGGTRYWSHAMGWCCCLLVFWMLVGMLSHSFLRR